MPGSAPASPPEVPPETKPGPPRFLCGFVIPRRSTLSHRIRNDASVRRALQAVQALVEGPSNAVGRANQRDREAWVSKALQQVPAGARLLDAGAGQQPFRQYCQHLAYVSQDFDRYDGHGDQTGLQARSWSLGISDIVSDITSIPEPDASFDAILCTEVIEHVPDPLGTIREFSRLLRPKGQLILTAPFCSVTHLSPYHFATGFSRYFFHHHLPAEGFHIDELTPNGNFFEYVGQELRRTPSVASQYARRNVRPWDRLLLALALRVCGRYSRNDTGSSSLLNYGYHLRAHKL